MKILHKKIKVIVVCLFTCALFVVGLFSIPTPLIAYAAETIDFEFYSLSVASQLSFSVRVPSSALNLLKQGRTANGYSYTDYFLQIKYSETENGYATSVWYHIEQSPVLCETPNASPSKYGDNLETPYPYDYTFTSAFLSSGNGIISIEIPSELKTAYYFSAQVIKATYREVFDQSYGGSDELVDLREETINQSPVFHNSVWNIGMEKLQGDEPLTDSERGNIQEVLGIKPTTNEIAVTVKYKSVVDYADIREESYTFNAKSVYAQNKTLIVSALYDLAAFNNIADFNVVYTGDYWENGNRYIMQKRIILQASDFDYNYNSSTQKGTLTVVYNDFQYKDLSLRIENNDPLNPLVMDYYTADVVVSGNTVTLTYAFDTVQEHLYNSCFWLFALTSDNIDVSGTPANVIVNVTDTALTVTFPKSAENSLMNLSLKAIAEIVEDIEYTLTYEYVQLGYFDGEITETWITSAPIVKMYSEIVRYSYDSFMNDYGTIINAAVSPAFLGGAVFYIPASMRKDFSDYSAETHTCKIVVQYSYNTLFKITNNYDDTVTFKALNHNSLNYAGNYFVDFVPDGYRVENISTSVTDKLIITNMEKYADTKVEVRTDTNAKEILPILIHFTDSWYLKINYLENYADYRIRNGEKDAKPCFAEKKQFSGTIKFKDYADIYNLTSADIEKIIGHDLSILGLATVENVKVTFDGVATYIADLSYSYAALKQIDYDGNVIEIKIPLTSYADWCKQYGQDWSILFLNTTERHYFKYSNDVTRENLYGFFSVAVFREQVSDLNYWFKNNTGDGCMTIFEGKQVNGSGVYKFFDNLTDKGIITSIAGYVGMSFCEIINDDNAMYYSYFFYLDGTSDSAYMATNGADNADDTDSAIKNAWEDVKDWAKNLWDKIGDSPMIKAIKIIAAIVAGILVLSFFAWLIRKILRIFGKGKKE